MTAAAVTEPKPRVVLIDLSSLFHPAWHSNENYPMAAFSATMDAVSRCTKKDSSALVAVCVDSRKSWRKELSPSYKAQREKLADVFYETFDRVKEQLRKDGRLLWESDGFEADDVIATACEEAVKRGHPVAICSADKDLMQLLRPGVLQLRTYGEWSVWGELEAETKFGVKVSQLGDWLALSGDASDNVKGARGVGPAHATEALSKWKSLKELGAALNADPGACGRCKPDRKGDVGEPYAWAKTINDNWESIRICRSLVELRKDVPIRFDDIYGKDSSAPEARGDEGAGTIAGGQPTPGLVIPGNHDAVAAASDVSAPGELPPEAKAEIVSIGKPAQSVPQAQEAQQVTEPRPSNDIFSGIAISPFSPEAQAVLGAPLTDDEISVRPDDGILYMSGESVRQRLQKAFGIGGWAIRPISTIVDKEAVDKNGKPQPRVYYTGQLWVLGRFVAESTGDGAWIKGNPKSDYGTALEGAKTNCISRCCKDIGMWSELRDKEFTKAWCAKNLINSPRDGWIKRPKQPIKQQQGA